jgi:hypothetical protein
MIMKAMTAGRMGRRVGSALFGWGMLLASVALAGTAPAPQRSEPAPANRSAGSVNTPTPATPAAQDLAARWGIAITALRLSAHGSIIDFRYRVLDPEKAAVIASTEAKPVLIDRASGAQLHVPSMPKVGQLRSTTQRLHAGKVYTALFTNPGKVVKPGNKVDIRIGNFHAEDLTVGE